MGKGLSPAGQLEYPILLVGEGQDEVRFFKAFLKYMSITNIQVEEYGGKDKLPSYLRTLPVRPGFRNLQVLGITRDADENPKGAFQSILSSLKSARLSTPASVGQIIKEKPSVGIYILPSENKSGMLEDLCLETIRGEPIFTCINQFYECMNNNGYQSPNNTAKAYMHSWLACQSTPGKRLGEAAESGIVNWDHLAFEPIKNFIQGLTNAVTQDV